MGVTAYNLGFLGLVRIHLRNARIEFLPDSIMQKPAN